MSRNRKILLATFFVFLVSFHQGAVENRVRIADKLTSRNMRLSNSDSEGAEYEGLERTVNSFLRSWSIAGASVAIARDGKLVYAKGFGYADTSSHVAVQPYHLFRVASISKLVTAVAVMKLAEDGRLDLDQKVFGFNGILNDPYFSNPRDKRVNDITVAHLLGHESGWTHRYGDQMFMPVVIADKMGVSLPVDAKTIVRFALDKRLHYNPGEGKAYSNLGYTILGLVIEKVSAMSYEAYCRKYILEPLGIYDMFIAGNLPAEKRPNEVTYYETTDKVLKPSIYGTGELLPPSYGGNDIRTLGGAGAWIASAPDLMRLLLAVDGFSTRPDLLSDQSISFMTDNDNRHAPVGWKTAIYNGTWWRTGSFPGSAGMMKRQADGLAWVVLFNSSAWNGPEIYSYIDNMMARAIRQMIRWPETDLFSYSLPVPVDDKRFYMPE
ncbi:MAG: beta-lactamase family protein [Bacteroidales bacterium]|nr:beta-lactamase family protein [Bacteroidales bacterium]